MTGGRAPAASPSSRPAFVSFGPRVRSRVDVRSLVVPVAVATLLALLLGGLVGRATAPSGDAEALAVVTAEVVPLAIDADALWTAGTDGVPPVGEALQDLRREDVTDGVVAHLDAWLGAYDTVLTRMVGVDVPPPARAVQRQFVTAVSLSRDAVEVLGTAARSADPALRRDLSSEVLRLRVRSEQAAQRAQASLRDLGGRATGGVSLPDPVPTLEQLR